MGAGGFLEAFLGASCGGLRILKVLEGLHGQLLPLPLLGGRPWTSTQCKDLNSYRYHSQEIIFEVYDTIARVGTGTIMFQLLRPLQQKSAHAPFSEPL